MTHAKFRIGGVEYDVPTLDTFTMDETIVLYNYTGLTIDELDDVEGLHPGIMAALIYVAIQRADPDLKASKVKALVGGINLMELLAEMAPEETEDADPPPPTSPESSDGSAKSSGDGSSSDSDGQAPSDPTPSGTPA